MYLSDGILWDFSMKMYSVDATGMKKAARWRAADVFGITRVEQISRLADDN